MSKALCIKSDFFEALLLSEQITITIHQKPSFMEIHARIVDIDIDYLVPGIGNSIT